MQNFNTMNHDMNHAMLCNDLGHEGINTHITCHDSNRLSKDEWWFLVTTLEAWNVFNPRAVVKKNPALAWRVMNLCKDNCVRVKGAYFTACFRRELFKLEVKKDLKKLA